MSTDLSEHIAFKVVTLKKNQQLVFEVIMVGKNTQHDVIPPSTLTQLSAMAGMLAP